MIYDFQTQLALGKKIESDLDTLFSQWYQIEEVTIESEINFGYDRIFSRNGKRQAIEYKADFKSLSTGNAYVELEVVSQNSKKNGWAVHSQADVIAYALVNGQSIKEVCNINPIKLKEALPSWREEYRKVQCNNKGWYSVGLLVPIRIIKTVCYSVIGE